MIKPKAYIDVILENKRQLSIMVGTLLFAATAIGVQRTLLTIYTQQLDQRLDNFVILGAAAALAVFGVSKAIGNYLGGNYSDRIGRLITARTGLVVLVLGSVIIVFTRNLPMFLIANTVIGIGVGILLASATVIFTDIASQEHRAKSLSIMELSVYLGTSVGSIMAGVVSQENLILAFVIALGLVFVATLISIFLKETKSRGQDEEKEHLQKRKKKMSDLRQEWRNLSKNYEVLPEEEIEDLFLRLKNTNTRHFKKRKFTYAQIMHPSILLTFSTGVISRISDAAIILIFPLLILSRNFTAVQLGIFTSSFTLFWAFGMLFSGAISDEIGRKVPIILGLITEFTGLALLFLPGLNQEVPLTLIAISLAGIGRGIYYPIPASIVSDLVTPDKRGQILGIYRFILDFGYLIGAGLLVLVVEPSIAPQDVGSQIFEAAIILVLMLILIQTLLVSLILKDPRPNFRQLSLIDEHIEQVRAGMHHLSLSLFERASKNTIHAKLKMNEAKQFEVRADRILETLIEHTYSGAFEAVDAIELLSFSQKMDKALGHALRSVRKLLLIEEEISPVIIDGLCKFGVMLDILVQEAVETITLVPIQVALASQQSYKVDRAEILLDEIHQYLFDTVVSSQKSKQSTTNVLLIQTIESLEKAANTIEDAVQIIRLVAIKHNI